MTKIYLLLFFYLLKIDFCGMEDEEDNNKIIERLLLYKDKKIPEKIEKPDYNKANENLFKIKDFKLKKNKQNEFNNIIDENAFNNQENEEGINNEVNNILGEIEAENPNILQNIRDKEGIFDRINIADDYNEGNIVECCCFVSRESVYRVKETSKKYFDENQNLKRSGKDIVNFNKDYRNALKNKYKKLLKKEKEKEEVINQREDYEEELKDQITNLGESYKNLLDYDNALADNFEVYNNDYPVIEKYYAEGKRLANDSINEIKKLLSSLEQKEKIIEELKNDIVIKKTENDEKKNLIEEKEEQINYLKNENTNLQNDKNKIVTENILKINNLNSEIVKLNKDIQQNEILKKVDGEKKNNTIINLEKEKSELFNKIESINKEKDSLVNLKDQKIESLQKENNILVKSLSDQENNFNARIKELENKIKELEINKSVCEVEKNKLENENKRLEGDIISKSKDIDNLQKEYNKLCSINSLLTKKYNTNLREIKDKNDKFFEMYCREFTNNKNNYNDLFQAITSLNLNLNNSFKNLSDKNDKNLKNVIESNENFNKKKQEEFKKTIDDFFEEQKKTIEKIDKSNNEKLEEISNYYKTTVKNFEKKYEETLDKIVEQAKNYENAVKELEKTLKTGSAKNSAEIVKSITNLTNTISNSFKKTQEELNKQKEQFSKDVKEFETNVQNEIEQNVNKIETNMNTLEKNIKNDFTNLNKGNIDNLNTITKNFKEEFKKTNEECINSNKGITTSLDALKQNISQWSEEKNELKKKIQELENENRILNEKKSDLNLALNNYEQENSSLNKEKEKLNSNYKKLQEEIIKIGKELIGDEENENEEEDKHFNVQILKIKDKIKELQEKNKLDEVNLKNLKEKNRKLKEANSKLNEEMYDARVEKLKAEKQALNKRIELFEMQFNNIKNQNEKNEKEINKNEITKKIEKLKEDINKKFNDANQVESYKEKINALEERISAQTEQLKDAALGYDLKEQQEFDDYANKMRQEHIREILDDTNIGNKMKLNSKNKNENEILKEEYYLPFIFENYNINNKWICLKKCSFCTWENKQQKNENKEDIVLKSSEIVYDKDLPYKSFDEVFFEKLEESEEFKQIPLKDIACKKIKIENDTKDEKKEDEKKEKNEVKDVEKKKLESYAEYNIYIRGGNDKILLGNQVCEDVVKIFKNFPGAELYLLFIKPVGGKDKAPYCYFYLKEIPLQKFIEYCAFVQGCSVNTRYSCYGEYLSMYINNIVTVSAAIERNNFKYFTKEDLQSIFSSLFSNMAFKGQDISQPKQEKYFIPKGILSYPELLIKPLNKNEYTASDIIEKELQHPYIEKKIKTKVREYDKKTVFWYKCDMQDPVTYLLSECIGLGNYGYIGRFYKRDGQGNYYPVALKLTLDSETHAGGSHKAIMKEIKAGKAAAVMGCNRMIYSNRAGLIEVKNSNFIDKIEQEDFSNMFLNPLEFIEGKNKMNEDNKKYKELLLAKQKFNDISDYYYSGDNKIKNNTEKWNEKTFKKDADYEHRIKFLKERFGDFYNSENFKKFQNLMFNKKNKVKNKLLYVMEMDIIDETDEDLYTETTTEKTKNNEGNEENMEQNNKINKGNKEIDINDNIKKTINNIAEYLTAQYKCRVIHGDIKAKNMTKDKFLDFGSFDMVSNYETKTGFSDVVGTPEYWDLVRIFNKNLDLVDPYDVILKDYQLSDLYASIVALYYYMFKEYPAFATLIIIIKSILKHYINDVDNNKDYCNEEYEADIKDFIDNFPTGKELVECTKAFEKDKKLKKQIKKDIEDNNILKEEKKKEEEEVDKKKKENNENENENNEEEEGEENEENNEKEEKEEKENLNLNKFNKYLKEVEDKNYLSNEVKQLRYCIYKIIQNSLLTVEDVKKEEKDVDKNKLFFIMSKEKKFYSKSEDGCVEVNEFSEEVVEKLIKIYKNLREQELKNLKCLINNKDEKKNMLGRIMYQILQQGTFANSEKYPAFEVYKNEHSYNNEAEGKEDYRRDNLVYRKNKEELINKIRNKDDQDKIRKSFEEYKGFWEDYEKRLSLRKNSYLYTLEPLSIKSLITQQPYYQYEKSFINIINEEKKENEENK